MIGKLLETFFRHRLLLLLPPLVIPLVVGPIAVAAAPSYYETFASVWVGTPTITRDPDYNQYISPAQNQANRLGEMMRTRTFVLEVANRTSLAPLTGSKSGQEQVQFFIWRNFKMTPTGSRLITLAFRAPTPQLSFEVLNGVLETYRDKAARDRTEQASATTSFYESQLRDAEAQLNRSQDALRRYSLANPRLSAADPTRSGAIIGGSQAAALAASADPQLADLLRRIDNDQALADRARRAAEEAQAAGAASLQGQDINFQIVDQPQVPTELTRERRKALVFPIGGMLAGVGLSTTILVLLTAADRSVRSEHDLAAMPAGTRVVGVVPRLRVELDGTQTAKGKRRKASQRTSPDAVRRALGFVAGASLPGPPVIPAVEGAS